jgi:hypothetical protein
MFLDAPLTAVISGKARINGKEADYKIIREEFDKLMDEEMRKCWRHNKAMVELFDKRAAG